MSDIPTAWAEPIDPRVRLARDRLAFALSASATGMVGAYMLLVTAGMFPPFFRLRPFIDDPRWDLYLGGPSLVANALAALLLLGGNRAKGTQARAVLLVLACLTGLGFWCAEHAHRVGIGQAGPPLGNDPLRILGIRLVALVRIAVLADLAALSATVRGDSGFDSLRRSAISMATVAFLLWLFVSVVHLDWGAWPLRWRNIRDLNYYLLLAASIFCRAISFGAAALLCGHASARARRDLEAIRAKARANDPFGPRPWPD